MQERLSLCELKNQDLESRVSKLTQIETNRVMAQTTADTSGDLELRLTSMINQQGKDIAKDFIDFQTHFKKFMDPTDFIRDEISKMEQRVSLKLGKSQKMRPIVTDV